MQTTIDRLDQTAGSSNDTVNLKKRNRLLGWVSGMLALAVIGLGTWLIIDSGSADVALTPAQERMLETIDSYLDAWNTGDGAAAATLVVASGYHDNLDDKYYVEGGELEGYVERVHRMGMSVSRSGAAFSGDYVLSTEHIPADSETGRPSIYWMSPDGSKILWHLAP